MNKYIKGRDLTLPELMKELKKRRYVFLRNQPKHPAFIEHMMFGTVCGFVESKMIYKAIKTNIKEGA